ncbi:MarR family winged helix-turn-helix transcriptional regulator [Gymnodinialimonas sp.]
MEPKILSAPRSVGRQLTFAGSVASAVANRLLEPHGLTLAQWAVLSSIWRNGDLSVKEIAELTGNAPPAASRIVDRMVSGGLLVRQQSDRDRRAVTVAASDKGDSLRHLAGMFEQVNDVLLADLDPEEVETLFTLLARVEASGRAWLAATPTPP